MAASICQQAASSGAVLGDNGQRGSIRDLYLQTARKVCTIARQLGYCLHLQQPPVRLTPSALTSGSCGCALCAGSRHCLDACVHLTPRPAAPLLSPRSPVRMPAGTSLALGQLCWGWLLPALQHQLQEVTASPAAPATSPARCQLQAGMQTSVVQDFCIRLPSGTAAGSRFHQAHHLPVMKQSIAKIGWSQRDEYLRPPCSPDLQLPAGWPDHRCLQGVHLHLGLPQQCFYLCHPCWPFAPLLTRGA